MAAHRPPSNLNSLNPNWNLSCSPRSSLHPADRLVAPASHRSNLRMKRTKTTHPAVRQGMETAARDSSGSAEHSEWSWCPAQPPELSHLPDTGTAALRSTALAYPAQRRRSTLSTTSRRFPSSLRPSSSYSEVLQESFPQESASTAECWPGSPAFAHTQNPRSVQPRPPPATVGSYLY